jgi:hypothetical protein
MQGPTKNAFTQFTAYVSMPLPFPIIFAQDYPEMEPGLT